MEEDKCKICEFKHIAEGDDFCYMFKDKVENCGQFRPIPQETLDKVSKFTSKLAERLKENLKK